MFETVGRSLLVVEDCCVDEICCWMMSRIERILTLLYTSQE